MLPFLVRLPALAHAPACSADSRWQGTARTLPACEEMELGHGVRGQFQPDIRDWAVGHSRGSTGGLAQLGCIQVAQPWEVFPGALKGLDETASLFFIRCLWRMAE